MNTAFADVETNGLELKLSHLIANRIRITYTYGDKSPWVSGQTHFRVTMRLVGTRRRMTVDYWSTFEPDACSVFSCVQSDAGVAEYCRDLEDFCAEYGYDSDSRKAEAIYKACLVQGKRLQKFLGSQFDTFMGAERDI